MKIPINKYALLLYLKARDIYISPVKVKPNSSGLQSEMAYWPAQAVGGAAQFNGINYEIYQPAAATTRIPTYNFKSIVHKCCSHLQHYKQSFPVTVVTY